MMFDQSSHLRCPHCSHRFPFYVPYSCRFSRGLFRCPYLKCPECRRLSRVTISAGKALVFWPLGIVCFALVGIAWERVASATAQNVHPLLECVCAAVWGIIGPLGLRFSSRLDPLVPLPE
jgi:hypothetical protein